MIRLSKEHFVSCLVSLKKKWHKGWKCQRICCSLQKKERRDMEQTKLDVFLSDVSHDMALPYSEEGIRAGFPSPAQDYMTGSIDLNKELVRHEETTFYARVAGDSMKEAGIGNGDLVIIDKSLQAKDGDYVAAYVDGEFTLKQFKVDDANHCAWLLPANEAYHAIKITEENDFVVWGVVTYVVRKLYR